MKGGNIKKPLAVKGKSGGTRGGIVPAGGGYKEDPPDMYMKHSVWKALYWEFLNEHANERMHFSCAEYFVLNNREFNKSLARNPNLAKLWAYREQVYEGDCPFMMIKKSAKNYKKEVADKINAWRELRGMKPVDAANEFENLTRELSIEEPPYIPYDRRSEYPMGPERMLECVVLLQKHIRKALCAKNYNYQKYIVRSIRTLRRLSQQMIQRINQVDEKSNKFDGFNAYPTEGAYTCDFSSLDDCVEICAVNGYGGFVIKADESGGRVNKKIKTVVSFRLHSAWDLKCNKIREQYCTLYTIMDSKEAQQEKREEAERALLSGEYRMPRHRAGPIDRILWMDDDLVRLHLTLQPEVDLKNKGVAMHGIFIADIAEVRTGVASYAYYKGKRYRNYEACLSLVGSECCLDLEFEDKEERDWWVERFELLIDQYEMIDRKRLKVSRRATLSPSGRRKPFNFKESVEAKLLQKDLENGIQVKKYGRDGRMERRQLFLVFHDFTTQSKNTPRPRLVYVRTEETIDELDIMDNKGIDICDISELRSGTRSYNFDKAKHIYDIKKMRTKAISIVGSERTMCFEIITDSSNSMEARDRIFSALELLRYSFKRLLANFGEEDQEVENIKNGRIMLPLSRHYDYLLKPRNDRRVDEQAVIALQSTVGIMAAVTIDEEMLQRPITEEDRARYKRSFRLFDKDGSGSIDAMELMKAMNELGRPTNLDQSIKIIREFDADNSGTIEENEFIGMMRQTYQDDEAVESLLVLYNKLYPHKKLISKDEFSSVMNLYATYKDPQDINPPFLYKKFKSGPRIFYYYDEDPEIKVKRKRKELARDRTVTAEDDRLSQENLKSLAEFADVDADGLIYPQDYTHWLVQSLAD